MTWGCYRLALKHLDYLKDIFCSAEQNYLEGYLLSGHLGWMKRWVTNMRQVFVKTNIKAVWMYNTSSLCSLAFPVEYVPF